MRFASISIDLDGIDCYHAIHGLPPPTGPDPAFACGLPRFLELVDGLGLSSTLFAIGRDLVKPECGPVLRNAVDAGHEVANHSFSHDYRLTERDAEGLAAEIRRAHRAIERVCGEPPVGFRAPGYNTSEPLIEALEQQGYLYDSSVFPSPAYFALRALAIGLYRLRRQPSRSLTGDLWQFLAPRDSYRPQRGALHRRGHGDLGRAVLELPVATLPFNRLPYIGTNLAILPAPVADLFSRWIRLSKVPINLELHAIDFVSADDPGVDPALVSRQRDLQVPVATKLERLQRVMGQLAEHRQVLRLDRLAREVAS